MAPDPRWAGTRTLLPSHRAPRSASCPSRRATARTYSDATHNAQAIRRSEGGDRGLFDCSSKTRVISALPQRRKWRPRWWYRSSLVRFEGTSGCPAERGELSTAGRRARGRTYVAHTSRGRPLQRRRRKYPDTSRGLSIPSSVNRPSGRDPRISARTDLLKSGDVLLEKTCQLLCQVPAFHDVALSYAGCRTGSHSRHVSERISLDHNSRAATFGQLDHDDVRSSMESHDVSSRHGYLPSRGEKVILGPSAGSYASANTSMPVSPYVMWISPPAVPFGSPRLARDRCLLLPPALPRM